MSEPIVFISNQRVKTGMLREYEQLYREVVERVRVEKPGTVAHLAYATEDGSEVSIVHVFPDAQAMEAHMVGVDQSAKRALEFVEIVGFVIYGRPTEKTLEMMQKAAGGGISLSVKPHPMGGYIRFKAE